MFGDIPDPGESERTRSLQSEAETDRELKRGAPAESGLLGRWQTWREKRHRERVEAKARSHETLKNYKPPNGTEGGGAPF